MILERPATAVSQSLDRRDVVVRALSARSRRGWVQVGDAAMPCALGRGGILALKREGDGATPRGAWHMRVVLYRRDRGLPPRSLLPIRPIRERDGWCDAPDDRNYNRMIAHPYPASAERLVRVDHLYDIVVVLDHNQRPRNRGRGSAIFMHLARPGYAPTEGCIALSRRDLKLLLSRIGPRSRVRVRV